MLSDSFGNNDGTEHQHQLQDFVVPQQPKEPTEMVGGDLERQWLFEQEVQQAGAPLPFSLTSEETTFSLTLVKPLESWI